jgi:uncharacterized protein involved in response to NO
MNSPLPPILSAASAAPAADASAPGWPVLRLGFRPFYLLATAFSALAVPLWVAMWLGQVAPPMGLPPMLWHAHEMLFGFAAAVVVGFLLTAAKAWTGHATPRGALLGGLAGLWLAARVAAFAAPYALFAALDFALLPLVALFIGRVLWRAGNRRNLPLIGMLLLLAAANGAFHLGLLGLVDASPIAALHAGLSLIVLIECVMGGRVIPAFTMGATPGLKLHPAPRMDALTLPLTGLALAAWVFVPAAPQGPSLAAWVAGSLLGAAALLHFARLLRWQPAVTRRRPILWVLHAAYAWNPIGLALLALAEFGWVPFSSGLHALAVGAIGGLIIAMVTRTARGHTGRALRASGLEVAAYGLVLAAAALRALAPALADPTLLVIAAAVAWSAAFAIYVRVFAPWLLSTRLDGKDG